MTDAARPSAADPGAAEPTLVGRTLEGRFKILERLAAGGMGVVYRAEQMPLGRTVALKVLEAQNPTVDESFSKRFILEASAAAKLAHPNTIVVFDYGKTADGLYFLAMEYLPGDTLSKRLATDGPLAPIDAIHVALQIASSLRDAHEQGLVHRDLKPGNVMFAPRGGDALFIKVLDFGLVKMLGAEGQNLQLTQSGVMIGSPRYMAPEQVKSQSIDARTDIYSFGAVLYHMLTGSPPFPSGSAFEAMNHHVYSAPRPFKQAWPQCPAGPGLEAVVMRCLQKQPDDRFATMGEVMDALRACAGEAGTSAAMVGSYLTASSGSSGSSPGRTGPLLAPVAPAAAPSSPFAAPSSVAAAPARGPIKTMRFDVSEHPPPPLEAAPPAVKPRSSPIKLALMGFVLVFAAGLAAAAALLIPVGNEDPADDLIAVAEEGPATTSEPPPVPEPPPIPPTAEVTDRRDPVPPPDPVPPTVPTMLRSDPPGCTVRRDGLDLGDAPIPLLIEPGERWTLEISREGYVTRTVTVASGAELTVHLDAAPVRTRPREDVPVPVIRPLGPSSTPSSRPHTPRPDPRTPELDNPWAR
ncbi:MAG: serine/threonine-protein kinase [Sandaracinaceae bacterium]